MKIRRITKASVDDLSEGDTLWDSEIKGFAARRNRNSSVTFLLKTRIKGQQRWLTIGRMGSPWTPETARRAAIDMLAKANQGIDVGKVKKKEREKGIMFADVADRFLAMHGLKIKPATRKNYEGLVRLLLKPAFKGKCIDEIVRGDVVRAHASWHTRSRSANHAVSALSKMMNWAEDQGLRPENSNPCRRIGRYKEVRHERFLSAEEFQRLGQELARVEFENSRDPLIIAAIRLLVFTGARRSEILTCKWEYIDWERSMIRLPDSKTGPKSIPLNAAALQILKRLPRLQSNPYVLPGRVDGQHLRGVDMAWHAIRESAGLGKLRLHDLRHSFASAAVNTGESLTVLGNVLGHRAVQTTARYAHVANHPAAALTERVGAHLAQSLGFAVGTTPSQSKGLFRRRARSSHV